MRGTNRWMVLARCAMASVGIAALAAGGGCGKRAPAAQAGAGQGRQTGVTISVAPAVRSDITRTVDVTGSLVALQDVVVGAKMAGKLASVAVHEGDPVSAGQVVAVMDTADFLSQLRQAQANLQMAQTRKDQAVAGLSQAQTMASSADTSLAMARRNSRVGLGSAQKSLQSAQERLSVVRQGARAQERQQVEESVKSARANYERTRADLRRAQDLFRQEAISQSQLDIAQSSFDGAQAGYNSAMQALSLVREGARPEDVRQAELAVQLAQDGVTRAESDRDMVRLREQDVRNSRTAIDAARASLRSADAGVVQAQAAVKLAQDAVSNASIVSPIGGFVAQRIAEPGQQLGGGGPVLRIVAPGSVYFQAIVSESQYADVKAGQHATVTVDALPGRKIDATVTRVLPVASAASRSFTVRLDLGRTDGRLRPQMFARGSILIDTHTNTTLVPKDAVLFDPVAGRDRVFVASGGKAQERMVRTGYMNPESVEVLSGVHPGDAVVIAGQTVLQNGDAVAIQKAQ